MGIAGAVSFPEQSQGEVSKFTILITLLHMRTHEMSELNQDAIIFLYDVQQANAKRFAKGVIRCPIGKCEALCQ